VKEIPRKKKGMEESMEKSFITGSTSGITPI
jgi:hypothetical protein